MKKKVIYRSLPVILSLVTLFTVCFTPAAAASNMGLYSVDLLDTGSITWGTERGTYPNNYNGYGSYSGNNIYFHWSPPVQSIKLQYIYITVYSSVSPRTPVLYPYDGANPINGTLVGSYNSYYQYSFNVGTAIGDLTYCQRYGGTDRYFSLVSAQGYSNIYEPVTNFNLYGFEEYLTGGGDMDRVQFVETYGLNPPYSYEHLYPGRDIAYDYYYIDIPTHAYNLNSYSQLTFIYDYVGAGITPMVSLYSGGNEPVIVLDSEYIQTFTYSTHITGSNNLEFTPVTTQITVDLSEFDLTNYVIDICLCIQPEDVDNRTKQVTWINVRAIYLDQLVHEPTWYETFFGWIHKTLGFNTDKIIDKLDSIFSDSSDGVVADQKQEIQDNADSFNSSMEIIAGIEEPDVDLDDMFSHIPTFSPISTTILTTIVNIPEVLQITIISFIFMFAAIVLFGVR